MPSPKLEIALVALRAPSVTKVVPPAPKSWSHRAVGNGKKKRPWSLGGFRGVHPEKKKDNVEIGDDFGLDFPNCEW